MKAFFTFLTRMSLRFRLVTLILSGVIAVLGVIAVTQLKLELIPAIEFPQTVILVQVTGMTSDEVLTLITQPIEQKLMEVEGIVNVESTTTGAFGSVVIALNEFGLDQARLQRDIRTALDEVWLPLRRITAPDGQEPQAFAVAMLGDLTPDVLIYLHERDSNFLFQLAPEVWNALPAETIQPVLAYLSTQTEEVDGTQSPLRRLVDTEILPQLESLDVVASVSVSGGQALPGEENTTVPAVAANPQARSLLLELSPEVWAVVSAKVEGLGALDENAVATLRQTTVEIPTTPPALPASWQIDGFTNASDLVEMRTATRTLASVLNNFYETGRIVGPIGQTNDLTPDIMNRILAIAPTMLEHFEPEQLAAMSDDVFATLPAEYVANLDGFARDELAASALAVSITGVTAESQGLALPTAWRISPPELITFSFDDLPVATFSVSGTGEVTAVNNVEQPQTTDAAPEAADTSDAESTEAEQRAQQDIPEGPPLPALFGIIGEQLGIELNTADDLITITIPEEFAALAGTDTLSAAQFFSFLTLLSDPAALASAGGEGAAGFDPSSFDIAAVTPALLECNIGVFDLASGNVNLAQGLIGCIQPEVVAFLIEHDPTFLPNLTPQVFEYFSDAVLSLPEAAPPLPDVWDTLAGQPQFETQPLDTAGDLLVFGDGRASQVLNTINNTVPEQFAGYEVRLFDSLTPAVLRYWSLQEEDFYSNLDAGVVEKFSPTALAALPSAALETLDTELAARLTAIANGEAPSAAEALASLYTTNLPPADPSAPALNSEWAFIGDFYGVELDTADDFFRFPEGFAFPTAAEFINSIFDSPQGAAFAVSLFGNMPPDTVSYMLNRDPAVFDTLRMEALQVMPPELLALLPQALQDLAASGAEPFVPDAAITRANGASSLLLTIYKTSDANTVEAFHRVEETLEAISAENEEIELNVVFEQASFIEESIDGVAREGGLGGVFAILMILIFLSGGVWNAATRRTTGLVLLIGSAILLVILTLSNMEAAGGDIASAFGRVNIVFSVPLAIGVAAGLLFLLWPGNLPQPAWRSTLVTAVSIPLSVLMAFALMRWLPPAVHNALLPAADSPFVAFILRLFPESITLNIMTLSGLTVAIGRVVDDSIVVLENIFRQLQEGGSKTEAIIKGTRDVSIAIFAATVITVVVFLPLGLTGGLIGEFFLPFGLAVTYSLMASFIVAITVVPVLVLLVVRLDDIHEDEHGPAERLYLPVLKWALSSRASHIIVLVVAFASMIFGFLLFGTRPAAFLPSLGEPQITVNVSLPAGTKILETNELVLQLENYIHEAIPEEDLETLQTTVGGGGLSLEALIGIGGGVSENQAQITIAVASQGRLDSYAQQIRTEAEGIFGAENVTVSAASVSEQGFGAFALVVSGPPDVLREIDPVVIETLNTVPGLTNVSSTLSAVSAAGASDTGPVTYLRVDGETAVSYSGELETEDSLNVIQKAKEAVLAIPNLPDSVTVSEGFETQIQTEGFASLFVAMGIAIVIVIFLLIITFGSLVHWLDIILSIMVAPVGAAVALTLTNRVLGISALIGLLMLIGIVVTNAVVLIDRVMQNRRERNMTAHDALIEAGGRRLRPILMTAFATIFALLPLAVGLSEGAIIASELGTVVIGGLFSSTLLTLIVVPVAYNGLSALVDKVTGKTSAASVQPAGQEATD